MCPLIRGRFKACIPLNYGNYINLPPIQTFIDFIIEYVAANELNQNVGWANQLVSYTYAFDNADFITGIETRLQFHRKLSEAETHEQVLAVVNEIMRWGGLKPFPAIFIPQLQQALNALNEIDNGISVNWDKNLIGKRITAISKIYEMYNPRLWSIYDSRVGKGIQLLASLYSQGNLINISEYLRFQCPPGRSRDPINGFKKVSTPRQSILGFLYASWLFRKIAEELNNLGITLPEETVNLQHDNNWAVYHIEMIFFMLGR